MHLVLSVSNLSLLSYNHFDILSSSELRYAVSILEFSFLNVVFNKVLSAKFNTFRLVLFCRSFIYTKNNSGLNSEPCGSPTSTPKFQNFYTRKIIIKVTN